MKPNYIENYIEGNKINLLIDEVDWLSVQYLRNESFMSDLDLKYQYVVDGHIYKSTRFHPLVKEIMDKLNYDFKSNMNVCFLNYYVDHTKALNWHSDNDPGLDDDEPIHVVSFGQPREIWWKPIGEKGEVPPEQRQLLGDGSLFTMPPHMQETHLHRIPKGDKVMKPRISLTYRCWKI